MDKSMHTLIVLIFILVLVAITVLSYVKYQEIRRKLKESTIQSKVFNQLATGVVVLDEKGNNICSNVLANTLISSGHFEVNDLLEERIHTIQYDGKCYDIHYSDLSDEEDRQKRLITFNDTTIRCQQDKIIAELREKADRTSAFKSAFLANMSHEIRTPIHAIIGFVELILKEAVSDASREKLDMIKGSSYSLLAMINDVLDLSKIESGRMELVKTNYYISYIIRDIDATFSLMAMRKGLEFKMTLDENIPGNLYGDKIRLRGVLVNILNNAVKYTKEGSINFAIRVLDRRDDVVKLAFEVKDTGVGIKQEDITKLFETFSRFEIQENYTTEGIGIGLSIANGYVRLMGGEIQIESTFGEGSTFTVILDQKIMDDTPIDMSIIHARKKKTGDKFQIENYNVLVVDDNPVNLMVADGLMKSYGLTVDKAEGGREAVDACRNKEYPIVFMDQMMPEVDGIMAMKEIRELSDFYRNTSKIIVLTADAMYGVRDRLMQEGFDEYLCKPLEMHRLESILQKYIPEENITFIDEKEAVQPIASPAAENIQHTHNEKNEIPELAANLGLDAEILEKKVQDCGGTLEDYCNICKIAYKHGAAKIEKLRTSQETGDYERYTIEVHALKSSLASIGAMALSNRAKEQEYAGKEKNYKFIDENMEELLKDYQELLDKIGSCVVGEEEQKPVSTGDEWTADEIHIVRDNLKKQVDDFDFSAAFDTLDGILKMPMGEHTREMFVNVEKAMNDMDIDKVKELLNAIT